ncbi:MAG: hypothetical protein AAGE52_22100 [Myxococcota bacterium]
MKFQKMVERAHKAVAAMPEATARRIAEQDADEMALVLSSSLSNADAARIRRLVHQLCTERVGR